MAHAAPGRQRRIFVPKNGSGFLLAVEARAKQVGDKPPGVDVVAGIEKFDVNVFGSAAKLVTIPFKHLLFKVESGRKPEVDVMFEEGGVGFDGILAFIEMLSKLIPGAGFSDPPALEVDAEGIRASFSVPIPSIAVGVFSMQNMRLSAGFEVPFIGNPLSVSFAFCTREEPFILTIMMIGGGGFVGITLSPRGMLLLEAALEARAQLAVDFRRRLGLDLDCRRRLLPARSAGQRGEGQPHRLSALPGQVRRARLDLGFDHALARADL